MRDWTARLVAGLCAQAGCTNKPLDSHCLCSTCRRLHNEQQKRGKRQRYWALRRQLALPLC